MMETLSITYAFTLDEQPRIEIPLRFELQAFTLVPSVREQWPSWTELDRNKCTHCPLDPATSPRCPLAGGLVEIVEATSEIVSHSPARVEVINPERKVVVETTVGDGLRSLMGLVIPASGCPHTAPFRPMARFHLPFSNQQETLYRVCSMYLLAQRIRGSSDLGADAGFDGLGAIYAAINLVNQHVVTRLQEAGEQDSSRNAVTLLDVFAQLIPFQFDEVVDEMGPLFSSYLAP